MNFIEFCFLDFLVKYFFRFFSGCCCYQGEFNFYFTCLYICLVALSGAIDITLMRKFQTGIRFHYSVAGFSGLQQKRDEIEGINRHSRTWGNLKVISSYLICTQYSKESWCNVDHYTFFCLMVREIRRCIPPRKIIFPLFFGDVLNFFFIIMTYFALVPILHVRIFK